MKALQTIMLSCVKASEYLNLKEEKALSFKQGLQLKMHLLACKTCRAYEKQSETIKTMFGRYQEKVAGQSKNKPFKNLVKNKVEKL